MQQHGHVVHLHEQMREPPPQAALIYYSLLLACPLILLLLIRCYATSSARAREEELLRRLPAPPRKLPVIGHLRLVGRLPHVSLRDLAAEHSRDGLMVLRLGAVPTLVVSSPRAAQAVLRMHDQVSRAYSPVADILFYGSTDVAFAPYGEHPVIGHLRLVGCLPHVSLRDLAAEHSRDGLMVLRLGAVPTLVVSSPRDAQAVLRMHDQVSRAYSPVADILFYGSTDVAFAPYG